MERIRDAEGLTFVPPVRRPDGHRRERHRSGSELLEDLPDVDVVVVGVGGGGLISGVAAADQEVAGRRVRVYGVEPERRTRCRWRWRPARSSRSSRAASPTGSARRSPGPGRWRWSSATSRTSSCSTTPTILAGLRFALERLSRSLEPAGAAALAAVLAGPDPDPRRRARRGRPVRRERGGRTARRPAGGRGTLPGATGDRRPDRAPEPTRAGPIDRQHVAADPPPDRRRRRTGPVAARARTRRSDRTPRASHRRQLRPARRAHPTRCGGRRSTSGRSSLGTRRPLALALWAHRGRPRPHAPSTEIEAALPARSAAGCGLLVWLVARSGSSSPPSRAGRWRSRILGARLVGRPITRPTGAGPRRGRSFWRVDRGVDHRRRSRSALAQARSVALARVAGPGSTATRRGRRDPGRRGAGRRAVRVPADRRRAGRRRAVRGDCGARSGSSGPARSRPCSSRCSSRSRQLLILFGAQRRPRHRAPGVSMRSASASDSGPAGIVLTTLGDRRRRASRSGRWSSR